MTDTVIQPYPAWTETMTQLLESRFEIPDTLIARELGISRRGYSSLPPPVQTLFEKTDELHAYYYAWTHRVAPLMSTKAHRELILNQTTATHQAQRLPKYWITQAPPLLVLMRGAPGAGKSTWARQYRERWPGEVVVISATDYFRDAEGNVQWCVDDLRKAHNWCGNVLWWLKQLCTPRIVVDNMHLRLWEMSSYQFGRGAYRIFQKVCTGTFPNTSVVPDTRVKEMRANFEKYDFLPHYDEGKDS
jgi:hypothetical protein